MTFEVKISDKHGLWGSLKLSAPDFSSAEELAKEYISEMVRIEDTEVDLATLKCNAALIK